jgi:hypothetical protein
MSNRTRRRRINKLPPKVDIGAYDTAMTDLSAAQDILAAGYALSAIAEAVENPPDDVEFDSVVFELVERGYTHDAALALCGRLFNLFQRLLTTGTSAYKSGVSESHNGISPENLKGGESPWQQ